jgi:hypothetical protein
MSTKHFNGRSQKLSRGAKFLAEIENLLLQATLGAVNAS